MTTQLDRIENMLILLLQDKAGMRLNKDSQNDADLYNTVRTYTSDLVENGAKV